MTSPRFVLVACLLLCVCGPAGSAQGDDAQRKTEALLARADARVGALRDIKANVRARTRLSLLPAVNLSGQVYFKRPNQVKVTLDHLPPLLARLRRQVQLDPPVAGRKRYDARWLREDRCEGKACDVLELRARDASTRLQTATLWLDRATSTIPKSILEYSDGTRCIIDTGYAKQGAWLLPSASEVEMQTTSVTVHASVTWSDYVLNSNLPDSVFSDR